MRKKNSEMNIRTTDDAYLYWLGMLDGIGPRKRDALLTVTRSARGVYEMKEELIDELAFLNRADKLVLKEAKKLDVQRGYEQLREQGVRYVMRHHSDYPKRLIHISDAPFGLFVKGGLPEEDRPSVAVIGARNCSEYGRYVASELGRRLAEAGIQVVSGLARGIDSIAQSACARANGDAFGVLGCGVDICYPGESRELYDRLLKKGGLLSEYPMGTQPKAGLFPRRNRIISGLADAVVVVEAREKSGTLITVDLALEQGREVYVIPGRVTDPLSSGCNRLIRQGAAVLTSPTEFIREVETLFCRQRAGQASENAQIYQIIEGGKADLETRNTDEKTDAGILAEKSGDDHMLPREGAQTGHALQQELVRLLYLQPKSVQQLYTELSDSLRPELPDLIETLFLMEQKGLVREQDGYFERIEFS